MSIINQMLRDLDARGAASNESSVIDSRAPVNASRPVFRKAVLLVLLLSAGGVAGYFALSGTVSQRKPPAQAMVAKREPVSVPIVALPPSIPDDPKLDEPRPVTEPPPAPMAAAPEPEAPAQKSPAMPTGKMARSLAMSKPAAQSAPAVLISAKTEPAVIKKMAEMSPEAEALQFHDEAQALRRAGKVDAAIGKYRLALERNPGMRNARIQLARLLQESGEADAALLLLKAGYAHQSDAGLAIATGRLLADLGRRDEALIWLERGRDSLRPADHALMGALLSQTSRYEEAVKAYQRALAAEPNQGGWLLGLGLALESLGRVDDAQMAYRNALERGDFKPDVIRFLRQKTGTIGQ